MRPTDDYQWFGTTQWTLVLSAGEGRNAASALDALESLCRRYWMPLYGYIRRKGYQAADAEDMTQGFFAHILAKERLASVAREKGKFRTFLLVSLEHFMRDELAKKLAKKRGGDCTILSLDWESAESDYTLDPADDRSPEYYFEKKWAMEVLHRALARLRESYEKSGKGELFEILKPYLVAEADRGQLARFAAELGMKESAVRMAVSRLRKRYRDMLRFEIADTVADPESAESEYRHICAILGGG